MGDDSEDVNRNLLINRIVHGGECSNSMFSFRNQLTLLFTRRPHRACQGGGAKTIERRLYWRNKDPRERVGGWHRDNREAVVLETP